MGLLRVESRRCSERGPRYIGRLARLLWIVETQPPFPSPHEPEHPPQQGRPQGAAAGGPLRVPLPPPLNIFCIPERVTRMSNDGSWEETAPDRPIDVRAVDPVFTCDFAQAHKSIAHDGHYESSDTTCVSFAQVEKCTDFANGVSVGAAWHLSLSSP
jgi:hypothetical protein